MKNNLTVWILRILESILNIVEKMLMIYFISMVIVLIGIVPESISNEIIQVYLAVSVFLLIMWLFKFLLLSAIKRKSEENDVFIERNDKNGGDE